MRVSACPPECLKSDRSYLATEIDFAVIAELFDLRVWGLFGGSDYARLVLRLPAGMFEKRPILSHPQSDFAKSFYSDLTDGYAGDFKSV